MGRLPVAVPLEALDEEALVRILNEPKNALTKQYTKLFDLEEVKLTFEENALRAIAAKALKRGTGARGLRAIIEEMLTDIMFDLPSREDVTEVKVIEVDRDRWRAAASRDLAEAAEEGSLEDAARPGRRQPERGSYGLDMALTPLRDGDRAPRPAAPGRRCVSVRRRPPARRPSRSLAAIEAAVAADGNRAPRRPTGAATPRTPRPATSFASASVRASSKSADCRTARPKCSSKASSRVRVSRADVAVASADPPRVVSPPTRSSMRRPRVDAPGRRPSAGRR